MITSPLARKILVALIFLSAFAFFEHQAAPTVTVGDSGEFMTVCQTLSVGHPPSFPLFMLSGHAFLSLIPWGNSLFRTNVFSSLSASVSACLLFLLSLELGANAVSSLAVAGLGLFTASFWENALVTEVFALNAVLTLGALLVLLKSLRENERAQSWFVLFFFVLGLALGNHQIVLLIFPAAVVSFILAWGVPRFKKVIGPAIVAGTLGFSIYFVLPIRSMKNPPLNWGQPSNLERLVRTVTRKDYGSLKLTVGETPERNWQNTERQLAMFGRLLAREVPPIVIALSLVGFLVGWRTRRAEVSALALAFLFSGPFFFLLSNLPFTPQSEGIMGRFFIVPTLMLVLLLVPLLNWRPKAAGALAFLAVLLLFQKNISEAECYRSAHLVWDYANGMLHTLPPRSALYMDGGDDAFYSLAALHLGLQKRPDLDMHDRGALIYPNPYGDDFRRLPKSDKAVRRENVERRVLSERPLYYSTLASNILPGVPERISGYLIQAGEPIVPSISWPLLLIRDVYPVSPTNYRTRALATFFPFMEGRSWLPTDIPRALLWLKRSQSLGQNIEWLENNLEYTYAHLGYDLIQRNDFANAEPVYRQWLDWRPQSYQAQSNLGVIFDRTGRLAEAVAQYQKTAENFPTQSDPVYNLAVISWRQHDWPRAQAYLEETLRRDPQHAAARVYLEKLKARQP